MLQELSQLTPIEWTVVTVSTAVCLLGSLLPKIGNLLGKLFLGEDPLLARWQAQRAQRKADASAERKARKEVAKERKALARQQKSAR